MSVDFKIAIYVRAGMITDIKINASPLKVSAAADFLDPAKKKKKKKAVVAA